VVPLHAFLGRFTQRLTRWPLNIPEARRQALDLHHPVGRDLARGFHGDGVVIN